MPDARNHARMTAGWIAAWLICANAVAAAPAPVEIRTDDVARFFALYDRTDGTPTAAQLQGEYLDRGTDGLREFVEARIGSAGKLARKIREEPQLYVEARTCAAALPDIRTRVDDAFVRLADIYPRASFPPVTLVVGRGTSGGTTTPSGVTVGLEVICGASWLGPDIRDRFVHLIAHEYAHVQQPGAAVEPPEDATLLYRVLLEGGAEFIAELTSGQVSNVHLQAWTRGKECEIEREFLAASPGTDVSQWLYNGVGDRQHPGDLGYWVGYRIASAHYARAADKQAAIAELIRLGPDDAQRYLEASGWKPDCPGAVGYGEISAEVFLE